MLSPREFPEAATILLWLSVSGQAQLPGTVDPALAPTVRTNGNIAVIATQADGKQLIGGYFSRVGAALEPSLARLNTDGSLDASFVPPTGLGSVEYIVAQANGKVLVVYELPPSGDSNFELVRLNADGSQDASFSPPTFSGLYSSDEVRPFVVAVQADGKVLVGGGFANDPSSSERVYKVIRYNADGSQDSGFQLPATPVARKIDSLLPLANGQLLVSGSFPVYDSSGASSGYTLLRLNADGSRDGSYPAGSGQNGGYDLALQPDGKLLYLADTDNAYAGGTPQRLNADGAVDTSFAPQSSSTRGSFVSLALQPDGKIVLGGRTAVNYPTGGGDITTQSGVIRLNADGSTDTTFNPVSPLVEDVVNGIGVQPDERILVGGHFLDFAGAERGSLGRLNADGSLDTTYRNEITNVGTGYAVAVLPGGQPILVDSGVLVNDALASNLVSFNANGSVSTTFAASLDPGQSFYNGNAIESTNALLAVQPDGKALVAGIFDPFYGDYVPAIKRDNADGSLDDTFTFYGGVYGALNAVVPQADGHVYIAGQINAGYERYTYPLDRLNADGSIDSTFSPPTDPAANGYRSSTIYALAVQPDGKIIAAGAFLKPYNGPQPPTVQRLNADGSLDTSFSAGLFNDDTYAAGTAGLAGKLALQPDGKVIVAGGFTSIGGVPANGIARLNADGSLDTTFSTNLGTTGIASIALQANGKILVGGHFTSVNGAAFHGVLRLQPDGSLDPLFFPGTGIAGTGSIDSLALAPDGSVFISGDFSDFGGQARDGIVRLIGGEVIAPVITSGTTAAAQEGQAFSYQIAASNNPTSYGVASLPPGLSVNPSTGLVSGTPTAAGKYTLALSAANAAGTGTATLTLTVAPALPVVTLTADIPQTTAGAGTYGEFTVTRTGGDPGSDLSVAYAVKGSAVDGADYVLLKGVRKIKAGKASAKIKVQPLGNGGGPGGKRVVTLVLEPGAGYTVGTTGKVKVKIFGQ